ncbi:MAG: lipocalin-like domain-containing protein [Gammaproteobacteria bacterium]|nr:lipocalin-like domain-containing protein [Gammaproteobacteria bacterium]
MSVIQEKIIGTWKLVHSVEIEHSGNKRYPFGEDAIGYIIYDAAGTMAVQISRRERQVFNEKDYLAYFGRYEIDLQNELVRHFVEGSLHLSYLGKILERKYHFYDNRMSLKPHDGTNREILWERV